MTYEVRYFTRSGNTEKLAKTVAEAVGRTALTVETPLEEKVDILFLGWSYYAFDMDEAVKTFLAENKEKIGKIVCFGTSAMMNSMQKPMAKITEELGIEVAKEEYHCRGTFGPFHKGHPNERELNKAVAFAKSIIQ